MKTSILFWITRGNAWIASAQSLSELLLGTLGIFFLTYTAAWLALSLYGVPKVVATRLDLRSESTDGVVSIFDKNESHKKTRVCLQGAASATFIWFLFHFLDFADHS